MNTPLQELMLFISTTLRAAMLAVRAVPPEVFSDFEDEKGVKDDGTISTIMDLLSQIMIVCVLRRLYRADGFLGEEKINSWHYRELEKLFAKVPALAALCRPFVVEFRQGTGVLGNIDAAFVWLLDPVDGSSNFRRRPSPDSPDDLRYLLYGFSLARVENGEDAVVTRAGIVYCPEFTGAVFEHRELFAPMLVFENGSTALFETRSVDWSVSWDPGASPAGGDLRLEFPRSLDSALRCVNDPLPLPSSRLLDSVVLRDSVSDGPSPFLPVLLSLFPDRSLDSTPGWGSSVVGLSMAVLGRVGIFGGTTQIWDHAALLGCLLAGGARVLRFDSDGHEVLEAYRRSDIEAAAADNSTKLRILVAYGEENIAAVEAVLLRIRMFRHCGGDNRAQPLNKPNDLLVTLPHPSVSRTLQLWDGESKRLVAEVDFADALGGGEVRALTVSANGQFVCLSQGSRLFAWNLLALEEGLVPIESMLELERETSLASNSDLLERFAVLRAGS